MKHLRSSPVLFLWTPKVFTWTFSYCKGAPERTHGARRGVARSRSQMVSEQDEARAEHRSVLAGGTHLGEAGSSTTEIAPYQGVSMNHPLQKQG